MTSPSSHTEVVTFSHGSRDGARTWPHAQNSHPCSSHRARFLGRQDLGRALKHRRKWMGRQAGGSALQMGRPRRGRAWRRTRVTLPGVKWKDSLTKGRVQAENKGGIGWGQIKGKLECPLGGMSSHQDVWAGKDTWKQCSGRWGWKGGRGVNIPCTSCLASQRLGFLVYTTAITSELPSWDFGKD